MNAWIEDLMESRRVERKLPSWRCAKVNASSGIRQQYCGLKSWDRMDESCVQVGPSEGRLWNHRCC